MPRIFACAALAALAAWPAAAGDDPLGSEIWADMVETELGGGPVVYDDWARLIVPEWVEEAHSVPLVVKMPHGADVAEVAVFAENNPIRTAVRIEPHRPFHAVGMNIRLERSTPVRVAARDAAGVWHVAQTEVTVNSPGGCSTLPDGAPGAELGDIALKRFDRAGGASRLKVAIVHPMHTGFAVDDKGDTVAAYYIDRVSIEDERGGLADVTAWAALSHDPVFRFDLPDRQEAVRVTARDTAGLRFEATAPPPAM